MQDTFQKIHDSQNQGLRGPTIEQADKADRKTATAAAQSAFSDAIQLVRAAELKLVDAAHHFAAAKHLESVRSAVRAGSALSSTAEQLEEAKAILNC